MKYAIIIIVAIFVLSTPPFYELKGYIPSKSIEPGWYSCRGCDTGLRNMPKGSKGWPWFNGILVVYAPYGWHDMPWRVLTSRRDNCLNCAD